jgi:hypothetical protein
MAAKPLPAKALVMSLRLLLGAFIVSITAFGGVALYVNLRKGGSGESTSEMVEIYGWILAGLGLALAFASRYVSLVRPNPQMVASLDAPEPVAIAMAQYFAQTVARGGMAEAFGLLGAVFYFVTGSVYFLAAPAIAIALLFRMMPNDAEVSALLGRAGKSPAAGAPPIQP